MQCLTKVLVSREPYITLKCLQKKPNIRLSQVQVNATHDLLNLLTMLYLLSMSNAYCIRFYEIECDKRKWNVM